MNGKQIAIGFPAETIKERMQLFAGGRDYEGRMNWQAASRTVAEAVFVHGSTKDIETEKRFEETYTDSTVHTAGNSLISSYLLSTSELGWINCDRFIKEKGEKTDLIVQVDQKAESDVKIIFHRIKAIMPALPVNGMHVFSKIPKGEKITIVAIRTINNRPHLAIRETQVTAMPEKDLTFKPVTMQMLKAEMKKLDRIN